MIDLATSLEAAKACLNGNELPEPIFQADKLSREFLRLNYEDL
jgi:deoxyinosine 3'endonuclease (endonuclease V)